jgi:hypothetical protein
MCFNEKIATEIGFLEAVIAERVTFLTNPKFNKNVIKGVNWVYNTYEQWQAIFSFASKRSVRRAFEKLENIGILKSGYFCRNKTNRTKWYTVDHSVLNSFDIGTCVQIGHMDKANTVENDAKLATSMCPNWPHPLSQEIHNNNTNNNTKTLGRTKYWDDIAEFNSKFVVVPTNYNSFESLPRLEKKLEKPKVEAKQKNVVIEEKFEETVVSKTVIKLQKSKSEKIEIEKQELPLSVINAMNEVKFEGSKYIRRSLIRWIEQYGENYVLEKIKMLGDEKWKNKNAVLTDAIRWDWKESPKFEKPVLPEQESQPFCKVEHKKSAQEVEYEKLKSLGGFEWWYRIGNHDRDYFLGEVGEEYGLNKEYYGSREFMLTSDTFQEICKINGVEPPKQLTMEEYTAQVEAAEKAKIKCLSEIRKMLNAA